MQPVVERKFIEGVSKSRLWFVERKRNNHEYWDEHVEQHQHSNDHDDVLTNPIHHYTNSSVPARFTYVATKITMAAISTKESAAAVG